jgi:hypothetical protein
MIMRARNVPWVVSQSDVEKHPKYKDGAMLSSILYDYGMEVSKGFEDDGRWKLTPIEKTEEEVEDTDAEDYYHISPFTGERCKKQRWVGLARQDGPWKKFVSIFLELPIE